MSARDVFVVSNSRLFAKQMLSHSRDPFPLNIRQANLQEASSVVEVLGEAARWLEQRGMPLWREDELDPKDIAADVAKGIFFIAKSSEEAAGVMRFQDEDALFWPDVPQRESMYIHRLAVRRKYAGTGVSTALLQWAVERTRSLGRRYLRLDTDAGRPRLRGVYEKFGFRHRDNRQVGPHFVSRYELDVLADIPHPAPEIHTERLLLRGWRTSDLEPFAALNSDRRVMRYFPKVLSREESEAFITRINFHFDQHGFGLWAVEVPSVASFIGFVGLAIPRFEARFTPCVEIGWRLAAEYWNRGYATEAARAVLKFAFDTLQLDEVVSFTVPANVASTRVMEKIRMQRNRADDFDHPSLPEGHSLRPHVLYRIRRAR